MNYFTVSRDFTFCASHRIEGHPKCGRIHGHNYKVTVSVSSNIVDTQGMVIDFGVLDREIKPFIDQMDHMMLVSESNIANECPYSRVAGNRGEAFKLKAAHSTAEEIAQMIHTYACYTLRKRGMDVVVQVQETERNVATYTQRGTEA